MRKIASSSLKTLLPELVAFLLLGVLLSQLGKEVQGAYVISFVLLSELFLAGGFLVAMFSMFRVPWALTFSGLFALWNKLTLKWALYFLPLAFFAPNIYPWRSFEGNKALYFSLPFLIARCLLYLVLVVVAARKMQRLPAFSMIIFLFIGTFFCFDWAMSLEKEWASNIYGLIYLMGGALGVWSLVLLLIYQKQRTEDHRDLYRLTVAFCMLWAYLHYSQFLVFWMANRPHEVEWYLERSFDKVPLMALTVLILKLFPVFSAGLLPEIRSSPIVFRGIMISILIGHFLEVVWLLAPPLGIGTLPGILITLPVLAVLSTPVGLWMRRES